MARLDTRTIVTAQLLSQMKAKGIEPEDLSDDLDEYEEKAKRVREPRRIRRLNDETE